MKFRKALKLLKQGECVRTPEFNIVKLDTERNCLTTFDGYEVASSFSIKDILSDNWQSLSEYELQCLKDDYDMEYAEPEFKEITGIEFIRDVKYKRYLVNFNIGRYDRSKPLHTSSLPFSLISKMTSESELESALADLLSKYNDCDISQSLLEQVSERFWRGGI